MIRSLGMLSGIGFKYCKKNDEYDENYTLYDDGMEELGMLSKSVLHVHDWLISARDTTCSHTSSWWWPGNVLPFLFAIQAKYSLIASYLGNYLFFWSWVIALYL